MYQLIYIAVAIVCAVLSAGIATKKNRSTIGWAVAGFLFGFIALIAIGLLPTRYAVDPATKPIDWYTSSEEDKPSVGL